MHHPWGNTVCGKCIECIVFILYKRIYRNVDLLCNLLKNTLRYYFKTSNQLHLYITHILTPFRPSLQPLPCLNCNMEADTIENIWHHTKCIDLLKGQNIIEIDSECSVTEGCEV